MEGGGGEEKLGHIICWASSVTPLFPFPTPSPSPSPSLPPSFSLSLFFFFSLSLSLSILSLSSAYLSTSTVCQQHSYVDAGGSPRLRRTRRAGPQHHSGAASTPTLAAHPLGLGISGYRREKKRERERGRERERERGEGGWERERGEVEGILFWFKASFSETSSTVACIYNVRSYFV